CQGDLVPIGNESTLQAKIAVIMLDLRRYACRRVVDPFAKWQKFLPPKLREIGVIRSEVKGPTQIFPALSVSFFPLAQFGLRLADVAVTIVGLGVDVCEIEGRTRR